MQLKSGACAFEAGLTKSKHSKKTKKLGDVLSNNLAKNEAHGCIRKVGSAFSITQSNFRYGT